MGVVLHGGTAGIPGGVLLSGGGGGSRASLLTLSSWGGFRGSREEGLGAWETHRRLRRGRGSTERGCRHPGPTPAPPPLIPLSPDSASAGWAGGPLGTAVT